MDLGNAVLTLTIDESGLVTGMAKAKDGTDQFVSDSKEQSGGFKEMWEGAFTALRTAGILLALEGFKKILDAGTEMLNAFAEDERATVTLTLALEANKNATNDTALSLHNWAEEMQKSTIFSHDQIEQQLVLLSGMNMSEAQMKNVMTAAVNLASVYHLDLDQAVRGLAMSLESGSLGLLTRQIPALKQFTAEQLEHGAAVNWVTENYSKGAQLIGDTTAGLQIRMGNLINEQKAKIGEAISDAYNGIQGLAGDIDTIGNIAATVVGVFLKSLASLAQWFKFSYDAFTGFFKLLTDLTIDIAKVLWAPIEWAFHGVIFAIEKAFVDSMNFLLDGFKNITHISLGHITLVQEAVKPLGETLTKIFDDGKASAAAYFQTLASDVKELVTTWTDAGPTIVQEVKKVQQSISGISGPVEQVTQCIQVFADDNSQAMIDAGQKADDYKWKIIELADLLADDNRQQVIDDQIKTQAFLDNIATLRKERNDAAQEEIKNQKLIADLAIAASKSIFEQVGADLAAGALSWKSFGEAALHAIGRIISSIGDQLAASAAADIVIALADLASIVLAAAAPGYFASAVIKGAGATAAWTAGGYLQGIKLQEGADFTVPPGYPNDSYPMRVQSGEHVQVTPAGGGGGDMIHVVVNLDSQPILDAVTRGSRNRRVLITARGVIP